MVGGEKIEASYEPIGFTNVPPPLFGCVVPIDRHRDDSTQVNERA
jgi:hypothetical protein